MYLSRKLDVYRPRSVPLPSIRVFVCAGYTLTAVDDNVVGHPNVVCFETGCHRGAPLPGKLMEKKK